MTASVAKQARLAAWSWVDKGPIIETSGSGGLVSRVVAVLSALRDMRQAAIKVFVESCAATRSGTDSICDQLSDE